MSKNLKILFLTSRLPYPPIGGDKLRVFNILKELKKLGHEITLITLFDNENDLKLAKQNNSFASKLIHIKLNKFLAYLTAASAVFRFVPFTVLFFYSLKMQYLINKELKENDYDLAFCHLIRTAEYIKRNKKIVKIVDLTDAISLGYERRLKLNRSLFDKFKISIEQKKILNYEKKIIKSFNTSFLIAQADKDYLSNHIDINKIHILQNGVDTSYFYFSNQKYDVNKIIMIGNMRTIANHDAAMYFGTKIFPIIKKQKPDAKFYIVGITPKKELYEMANTITNIIITGGVEDIREHLKDSVLSVCPVRIAAGVQNKILEAMSMGIPVVTTPMGAEGIDFSENESIIANNEETFANAVLSIIENCSYRQKLSKNARVFIENNYSWEKVVRSLNDELLSEIRKSNGK